MEYGGYGKTQRSRRHRASGKAQTPYGRPTPAQRKHEEPAENHDAAVAAAKGGSLLGSVLSTPFRAAASLINKVPLVGGYFKAAAPPEDEQSSDEGPEVEEIEGVAAGEQQQQQLVDQAVSPAEDQQGRQEIEEGLLADGPMAEEGTPVPLRRQQQGGPGEEEQGGEVIDLVGTPYDNVLAMLRQGPLSSPRFTFRPRSAAVGPAGGRSPVPLPQYAPSPSPPLFSAGRAAGGEPAVAGLAQQQRRLGSSRFAPQGAGVAATPSGAGQRHAAFGARAGSHVQFARTPLAGGAAKASAAAAPRFSALPPLESTGGAAAAATSLTPLTWTPMRSHLVGLHSSGGVAGVAGSKRKADSESPIEQDGDEGAGSRISLLDAQRRIRHRPEPSQGQGSAERRSWRAGRTPFHSGVATSRFARLSQQGEGGQPSSLILPGAPFAAAVERPKSTTDTARRILATLESLDQAVAKGAAAAAAGGPALGTTAAQQQGQQAAAAPLPPPPADSLGFAGSARSDSRLRVTFGGVSFAPSPQPPEQQQEQEQQPQDGSEKALAGEGPGSAPKAQEPAAGGWGDAFLAANKKAAKAAAEAAKKEADGRGGAGAEEGSPKKPFFFGAPVPAEGALPGNETPKLKLSFGAATGTAPTFKFGAPNMAAATAASAAESAPLANGGSGSFFKFAAAGGGVSGQEASAAAGKGEAQEKPLSFSFGGPRDGVVDAQVAVAVKLVGGVAAALANGTADVPRFTFGGKQEAKAEQPAVRVPVSDGLCKAASPAAGSMEDANRMAEEAAKSPLPFSDDESSPPASKAAPEPEKPAVPAASGGWDLDFLKKTAETAKRTAEAVEREIEGAANPSAGTAPIFNFCAPTTAAAPLIKLPAAPASSDTGLLSVLGVASAPAAAAGSDAATAAPESVHISFGTLVAAPAATATATEASPAVGAPAATSGWSLDFLTKNKAAADSAAEAAAKEAEGAGGTAQASSWSAAFLQNNKVAADRAAEAAAKEAEGAGSVAAPAVLFGATAATSTPAATPTFNFGVPAAPEPSLAASGVAAAPFSFGAAPAVATAAAGSSGFTFGAATAAAPAGSAAPAEAAAPSSAPFFSFSTASQSAASGFGAAARPGLETGKPAFSFGVSAPAFGLAAQASLAPTFSFGAPPSSGQAAPEAHSPQTTLSFEPFAAASQPAAAPVALSFGAPAAVEPAPSASAPALSLFGQPASGAAAPTFTFGAQAAGGAAPPSFGISAQPASAAAPSFAFGAQPASAPAAAASAGFQFGAAAPSTGAAPAPFGFGPPAALAAPAAAAPAPFAFGGASQAAAPSFEASGGMASAPAFGFGGGFGAPAQEPGFGGGAFGGQQAPRFGGFGAPQQQQPAFGTPQPAPVFGAAPASNGFGSQQPQGVQAGGINPFGGGMVMGTGGSTSQSEGRRKLKAKRAARK